MDKHLRKAEGDGTCGLALVPTQERKKYEGILGSD